MFVYKKKETQKLLASSFRKIFSIQIYKFLSGKQLVVSTSSAEHNSRTKPITEIRE